MNVNITERRIDHKVRYMRFAAVLCALFAAAGITLGIHGANLASGWLVLAFAGVVAAAGLAIFLGHPGPADVVEPRGMLAEEIVVDDHPAGLFCRRYCGTDDLDGGTRVDEEDFPAPVELERSGAHDEDFALGRPHLHRDDGLAGLPRPMS